MPIDSNIPLAAGHPSQQINDPINTVARTVSLADMMQQRPIQQQIAQENLKAAQLANQQRQQQITAAQQTIDDQKAVEDALRQSIQPPQQPSAVSPPKVPAGRQEAPISAPAKAPSLGGMMQSATPKPPTDDEELSSDIPPEQSAGAQKPGMVSSLMSMGAAARPAASVASPAQQQQAPAQAPPQQTGPDIARAAQILIGQGKGHLAAPLVKKNLDQWKEQSDLDAKRTETALKTTELVSQMFRGVKNQADWDWAVDASGRLPGIQSAQFSKIYSEAERDRIVQSGMKAADALKQQDDQRKALHESLEDFKQSTIIAASQMYVAKTREEAAAIAADLKDHPGIDKKAVDGVLATYNRYGNDVVRQMALTPEQLTTSQETAKRDAQNKDFQQKRLGVMLRAANRADKDKVQLMQGIDDDGNPAVFRVNKDDGTAEVVQGMKPSIKASKIKDYTNRLSTIDERKAAALDKKETEFDRERRQIFLSSNDAGDKEKNAQAAELEKKRSASLKSTADAFETERKTLRDSLKLQPDGTAAARPRGPSVAPPPSAPAAQAPVQSTGPTAATRPGAPQAPQSPRVLRSGVEAKDLPDGTPVTINGKAYIKRSNGLEEQ